MPNTTLAESEVWTFVIILSVVSPTCFVPRISVLSAIDGAGGGAGVGMYVMVSWRVELLYITGQCRQSGLRIFMQHLLLNDRRTMHFVVQWE